ncbi:heavy metal translocating P-type ATPase [Saxibacter everestensis]|uniref:Heavy metal translocating P-type ATPase n=1 Tax=Saxibacter everestensis TaxID=2909229 RepID=A0ABY8QQT3_9MICO|nr:heavy metal translocating P-type ATPase [Brevibacteriaceae bacterium ZFBP1038]
MTTTQYKVTGMTCGRREAAVREEVSKTAGVESIDVSAQAGSLSMTGKAPLAGAAMAFSSVFVGGNSLRLRSFTSITRT